MGPEIALAPSVCLHAFRLGRIGVARQGRRSHQIGHERPIRPATRHGTERHGGGRHGGLALGGTTRLGLARSGSRGLGTALRLAA